MEHRLLDEHGEQSPEMSLAVKLAFSRVCSLIYNLKNDIGEVSDVILNLIYMCKYYNFSFVCFRKQLFGQQYKIN